MSTKRLARPIHTLTNERQLYEMMNLVVPLDNRGEIYTFIPEDDTEHPMLFCVPMIAALCAASGPPDTAFIGKGHALDITLMRGITARQAARSTLDRRKRGYKDTPALVVRLFEGADCMIDGNHRMLAAYYNGHTTHPVHFISYDDVRAAGMVYGLSLDMHDKYFGD